MADALLNQKYPGEWVVKDGKLFKGDMSMNDNFALVDTIGELMGDTVTIFQADTRIATNVKDSSGKRAIGTKAAENVVEAVLKKGEVYVGKALVVGTWNQTAYKPIKSTNGQVIGMFYVGVPNTKYDEAISAISSKIILFIVIGLFIVTALGFYLFRSIVRPITSVVKGLMEGGEKVASASSQVSSASQSLADGASAQATSLEETSSSMEEMTAMTRQNAENAGEANMLMRDTGQVVDEANRAMSELTQSMQEITLASEETGKIIKTIDEIAFQTNLLALNAAVEAARAGEAGAGFAVVADEVRNLAMRAAEAAKNTSNLIEETVKKIKNGSEIVDKTNSAFEKVAMGSRKAADLVGEIAAASNEQAQGIGQINKAISEMDRVVQKNSASSEESASAAEELNAQAGEMKEYVEELVTVIAGNGNGNHQNKALLRGKGKGRRVIPVEHRMKTASNPIPKPSGKGNGQKLMVGGFKEVNPQQVIPLEEGEFKEF
jgi:methyl-accepting chemotaxis protein